MAAHDGHEFSPVSRPALAGAIGLNVLVEQLIGVQFRTVARHPDEPQALRVLSHQMPNVAGAADRNGPKILDTGLEGHPPLQ
jgi:hypothetical protein